MPELVLCVLLYMLHCSDMSTIVIKHVFVTVAVVIIIVVITIILSSFLMI